MHWNNEEHDLGTEENYTEIFITRYQTFVRSQFQFGFRKKDKPLDEVDNFRQICLMCSLCKLLEKMVANPRH